MTGSHAGGCRCGQVRFSVCGDPLITMACHCQGCQRLSGSAFSLSSLYANDAFEIIAGEPVLGGVRGGTGHYFCANCMSWLFTRPEGMDALVNIRSTMLDEAQSHKPFIETQTAEKLPWAVTGAVHSFERFPTAEAFPALLAQYAGQA